MHKNAKVIERLNTIDAVTLMEQPLTPPNFVVDNLIGQGLHILAGSPKVGKSWLALWLVVTIGKGEPVWGMATKKGTTLYLCLEDPMRRIQNRLYEITDSVTSNVEFCNEQFLIGKGLEEKLENYLGEHPDTVLIVIDTLQMIRGGGGSDSAYANDYKDLTALKKLADEYETAILLVHHVKKEDVPDVFSRISGTAAISGAVDSSFTLLEEVRGSGEATLYCIGRDIEYGELELARDENNVWQLKRDHRALPKSSGIVSLISALIQDRGAFIGTATELVELLNPDGSAKLSVRKIAKQIEGHVEVLRKAGVYVSVRRSNGKRLIELRSVDSDVLPGEGNIVPIDPDAPDSVET